MLLKRFRVERRIGAHDKGLDPLAPLRIRHADHGAFGDAAMCE